MLYHVFKAAQLPAGCMQSLRASVYYGLWVLQHPPACDNSKWCTRNVCLDIKAWGKKIYKLTVKVEVLHNEKKCVQKVTTVSFLISKIVRLLYI